MTRFLIAIVTLIIILPRLSLAYHHFMAMGYASCMTCHFNPNGNGPLNDYGRALFATELSSRWYAPKKVSDDTLAKYSRFFGFTDLPYWVRPHVKLRHLQITQNPGSQTNASRNIPMQREVGTAFILDQDYKKIIVSSFTFHDKESRYRTSYQNQNEPGTYLKELYGRFELTEDQWVLIGLQDKPFGIRDVNHTFLSRRFSRNTQYDQSLGALYFKSSEKMEFSFMGFMGNPNEDPDKRAGGFSLLYEYNRDEQTRLGASFLTQKNNESEIFAISGHTRMNLNYDAALSFETGLVHNSLFRSNLPTQSFYWLFQNMVRLTRGFNFLFEHELGRADTSTGGPWIQKTSLGFLTFPLPRSEVRIQVINEKTIDFERGNLDAWQVQSQFHLSL